MPTETHFRRDHFAPPPVDPSDWTLVVEGLGGATLEFGLEDLEVLPRHELTVVLECAGHRRAEFEPVTGGLPWQTGAVSEATWAGASLSEVLARADLSGGRFVLLEGSDHGRFRGKGDFSFSRALPIEKALDPDTIIAWEMNGEPLPIGHGAPVRAIVPGWYATDSIKWLRRIAILDEPFDGPFESTDYRLVSDTEPGNRLTDLPVHALIVSLRDGDYLSPDEIELKGIAWGGEGGVTRVDISVDEGEWQPAALTNPSGLFARSHWTFSWEAVPGAHTVAVRATDAAGRSQPLAPEWNEGGYANSSVQRVRVRVE